MTDFLKSSIQQLSQDCIKCYYACKELMGADFDSVMADICSEIVAMQHKSTKEGGISFAEATLLLLIPEPSLNVFQRADEAIMHKTIKAAFCWHAFEKHNLDKALSELEV